MWQKYTGNNRRRDDRAENVNGVTSVENPTIEKGGNEGPSVDLRFMEHDDATDIEHTIIHGMVWLIISNAHIGRIEIMQHTLPVLWKPEWVVS